MHDRIGKQLLIVVICYLLIVSLGLLIVFPVSAHTYKYDYAYDAGNVSIGEPFPFDSLTAQCEAVGGTLDTGTWPIVDVSAGGTAWPPDGHYNAHSCESGTTCNPWNVTDPAGGYATNGKYLYLMTSCTVAAVKDWYAWKVYHVQDWPSAPPAPVINDFTSDASCYAPGEAVVLESDVTGDVDSWLWEIYDSSDVQVWSSTDSVETIVDENFAPGLYQVQLYVENTGGNDFLSKEDWLNVTQAGGCGPVSNWTNPFPTQTTVVPTQQFYETMTMPSHIVTNMTGINEEINKGLFANMSQGYRDYFDYVGEQVNTTFTGTFRTLLSPVSLVVNAIAYAISLFSTSINALTVYTTVPLAITAIVINYMPWQIVTLITAGIAIDAILIIILGR